MDHKEIVDKATGQRYTSWDLFLHHWRQRNGILREPAQGDDYTIEASKGGAQ